MSEEIRILVVDDDLDILRATARVLESEGYQVMTASTGSGCREMVREHRPDLVLLDVVLPDVDGADVCAEIKSDPELRGTFVILVSGAKTTSGDQADGLDLGADGYIARPVSNRELKSRVFAMVRILLAERERDRLIEELRKVQGQIKTLSGLLPICILCKNIRDDRGYWKRIEAYIAEHSEAEFSHGLCPDCARKYYPGIDAETEGG